MQRKGREINHSVLKNLIKNGILLIFKGVLCLILSKVNKLAIALKFRRKKMERQDVELFLDKKVKLILKTNYIYSGTIQKISNTSLQFLDKFEQLHIFALDQIAELNEVLR